MHPAWGVAIAYVIGSLPFAYLAGRIRGVDLRHHGSGNLGATNAVRVLGVRAGIVVYLLDTLKGFVAAFYLPQLLGAQSAGGWAIAYAVAATLGHVRPLFLGFQPGGKGIATAGGAFLGLAWLPTLVAVGAFAVVFLASGYASAGSIAAAIALPLALLAWPHTTRELLLTATAMSLFAIWTHRSNIARLRRGEEHRFDLWRRKSVRSSGAAR